MSKYDTCKYIDGKLPIRDITFHKENLPDEIFNIDVVTSNDNMAEVFALKYTKGPSRNKIIGWVRNNDNWWFNLPHHGDTNPTSLPSCINLSPSVKPIKNLKITIKNVCSGKYRIDFHSVYYNRAIISGGTPENGGIIGSITADAICGELSFAVPGDLTVLTADNAPCAPDYGFKINLIAASWNHGTIAYWMNNSTFVGFFPNLMTIRPLVNPFAMSGDGTQIAYRGNNGGALNCFYRAPGSNEWTNTIIGHEGAKGVKMNGSISRGRTSNQIYYHGADNRLQVAFWNGSGWAHVYLTDWSSNVQNVDGGIGSQAAGGRIFYRGADGQLHFYFFESGAWQHSIFYQGYDKRPTKSTNIAVNDDGSLVAYGANDGKLVLIYRNLATGTYIPDYPSHEFVGGMVRVSKCGNSIFYRDNLGRLHQYFHNGVSWNSRVITAHGAHIFFNGPFDIAPGCDYNDFQVYYRGADGFIHVAFLWSGNYIAGKVLMCEEPATNKCLEGGYIGYGNGIVAYEAATYGRPSPLIQAYYYGTCG